MNIEEITYVFLINKNLIMSAGKVAAQVANVAVQLPKHTCKSSDPRTLILSASEKYMLELIKDFKDLLSIKWTVDSGNTTEYTYGALTCLGFKREEWMKTFTAGLQFYGYKSKFVEEVDIE